MKAALLFAAVLCLFAPPLRAQPLLLTHAHILATTGDRWLDDQSLLITGDTIAAIGPNIEPPPETKAIDATGLYLIPGLIDLHTHLLLHPYDEALWNDQVLKESLEFRTVRGVSAARLTLEAGFTTIRDLGTEGAGFADVALRDATRQWLCPGPRVFASTRAIVATGCYGPSGFDPRWQVPKGAQEADGPDGVRIAVRQQVAAGADWIKLYGDYRRAAGSAATPTFSMAELQAAVDEAHSAGKPVAVHATTDEGMRRAAEAGVQTIEHGYGASRETLQLMKAKGTVLVPTLAAAEAVALYSGWRPGQPPPPLLRQSRDSFALARRVGVTIAGGSDAGVFAHGTNARELELMVQYGMSPAEALRASTLAAAAVLGRTGELGQLAPRAGADLVALRADPLADIAALDRPVLVVARGRVIIERR